MLNFSGDLKQTVFLFVLYIFILVSVSFCSYFPGDLHLAFLLTLFSVKTKSVPLAYIAVNYGVHDTLMVSHSQNSSMHD